MNANVTLTLTFPLDQLTAVLGALSALSGMPPAKPIVAAVVNEIEKPAKASKPAKTEKVDTEKAAEADHAEAKELEKAKAAKAEPAKVTATPIPSIDELKKVAIAVVEAKGQDVLVAMLDRYKAKKLSEVPEAKRIELLKELLKASGA